MLPNDTLEAATQTAAPFSDDRVRHFFDAHKTVGKAIAESLGWSEQIAWDIYLFYAPGQKWEEHPPSPIAYAHQLTNAWADRDYYRVAADLTKELKGVMEKMIPPQ